MEIVQEGEIGGGTSANRIIYRALSLEGSPKVFLIKFSRVGGKLGGTGP